MIAGRRTMQTDGKQIILVTRKDIWLHEKWGQLYRHCLNWKHGMARVLCLAPKPSGKQTVLIFMAQKLGRETQRVPLNSTKTGPGWTRLCLQDWFLPLNGPFCHLLSFANMPALLVWADLMPAHASLHLLRRVTRAFNFDLAWHCGGGQRMFLHYFILLLLPYWSYRQSQTGGETCHRAKAGEDNDLPGFVAASRLRLHISLSATL